MTMTASMPLVTVVIPYFNRETTIRRAVASVERQAYPNIEIIIVDDASATPLVAAGLLEPGSSRKLTVLRQDSNRGPGAARNRGIAAAEGRYIAFLDSDDEWDQDKIPLQVEAVLACDAPDHAFCAGTTVVRRPDSADRPQEIWNPAAEPLGNFLFVRGGTLQTSSFLVSRSAALRTPFQEDMRRYEDNLFALQLIGQGCRFVAVPAARSVWYLDKREDQASGSSTVPWTAAMQLLDGAGDQMSPRARLSFEIRFIGTKFVRRHPLRFAAAAICAMLSRAVSPRNVLGTVYRSLVLGHGR